MINVVDLETTGFDPKDGGVVEIACVAVGDTIEFTEDGFVHSLANPGCPIGHEAMGTHHITEAMVADAQPLDAVIALYGLDVYDVWAAHNAPFDRGFLPAIIQSKRWICTWRCSMHLWPDAPSHKNQALRYWLNLDVSDMPEEAGRNAHRALYDAWVTAKLLKKMLEYVYLNHQEYLSLEKQVDYLVTLSTAPILLRRVTFGKYRDMQWADVDRGYMRWCLKQDFDQDVIHTCRHYLGLLV